MVTKFNICFDCSYYNSCNLTDDKESVSSCSEFEPGKTSLQFKGRDHNPQPMRMESLVINLCHTCTIQKDCIFRDDQHPIIHCELYQ